METRASKSSRWPGLVERVQDQSLRPGFQDQVWYRPAVDLGAAPHPHPGLTCLFLLFLASQLSGS